MPLCVDQGVGVIPWSPLARGRLTTRLGRAQLGSDTDDFGKILYFTRRTGDRRAGRRHRRERGASPGAGRAGVDPRQVVRDAPIVGATKVATSTTPSPRSELELTDDEIARLE